MARLGVEVVNCKRRAWEQEEGCPPRPITESRPLINAASAARRLGFAKWRVYELCRQGILPCTHFGRSIYFDPDALDTFIRNGGKGLDDALAGRS